MEYSAGFAIICNDKILLAHPTLSKKDKMWGIAKGKIEENEEMKSAAIRETKEEIGIDLSGLLKGLVLTWYQINYFNANIVYKKLFYSVIRVESLSVLGLESEILDKSQLALDEIDSARFYTKEEALNVTFWRQKSIINRWL